MIDKQITIDFPLRGEWTAAHTPAEKIPSHGTDFWGQRFAYDFLQINWQQSNLAFYNKSTIRYFTIGISIKDCLGFGESIHSPINGTVLVVRDGLRDHQWLHPIVDLLATYWRGIKYSLSNKPNIHKFIGNYIIIKLEDKDAYAFFAHIKNNSIRVKEGDKVKRGESIANVGHTGNSTAPHLHFHIMDSEDITKANGLPCNFKEYEVFSGTTWGKCTYGIPGKGERIRFIPV